MLKALYNFFESLVIENDVLCRKWSNETSKERSQIVLPKFASVTILKEAHRQVGHLGVAKTFEMIQRRFFWPGFFKTTEEFCKSCKVCARNKVVPRPRWRLRPIEVVPFYMIGVDLIGPLKSTRQGNKYILSIIDYYTKYAVIVEIPEIMGKLYISVANIVSDQKRANVDVTSDNIANFDRKFSADKIYYNFSQKNPNIKTI